MSSVETKPKFCFSAQKYPSYKPLKTRANLPPKTITNQGLAFQQGPTPPGTNYAITNYYGGVRPRGDTDTTLR